MPRVRRKVEADPAPRKRTRRKATGASEQKPQRRVRSRVAPQPEKVDFLDPKYRIPRDQLWLLAAAASYNTEEDPFCADNIYDHAVKEMIETRDQYPNIWKKVSIYPEVFVEDDSWEYTSQHFPINDEILERIALQRRIIADHKKTVRSWYIKKGKEIPEEYQE